MVKHECPRCGFQTPYTTNMSMKGDHYWKLKQDIISLIQNQTQLYNPVLEDMNQASASASLSQ